MNMRFSPPVSGIVGKLSALFGRGSDDEGDNLAIDVDDEGKTLYKEDIIAEVFEDLKKRKDERGMLEQQWTLNANFLVGKYCDISRAFGFHGVNPPASFRVPLTLLLLGFPFLSSFLL